MLRLGLNKRRVDCRHGLAAILTVVAVGRTRHSIAALHRLFRRCHGQTVGSVCRKSNNSDHQEHRSGTSHHSLSIVAASVTGNSKLERRNRPGAQEAATRGLKTDRRSGNRGFHFVVCQHAADDVQIPLQSQPGSKGFVVQSQPPLRKPDEEICKLFYQPQERCG